MKVCALLMFVFICGNVGAAWQEVNWRVHNNNAIDIYMKLNDKLMFYWDDWGSPETVVQIPYPGMCGANDTAAPIEWDGIACRGDCTKPVNSGGLTLKFISYGSYILTSPMPGNCNAKWMQVVVS